MATRKNQPRKQPWYQARWTYIVAGLAALFLAYTAALLAIDTASMFAYAAAGIFIVVGVRALVLGIVNRRS